MNAIKATWKNGQIVPAEPVDWPEGSDAGGENRSERSRVARRCRGIGGLGSLDRNDRAVGIDTVLASSRSRRVVGGRGGEPQSRQKPKRLKHALSRLFIWPYESFS